MRIEHITPVGLLRAALMATVLLFGGIFSVQAQDQDMLRLQDQLRDCRGDACVPIRDQMMSQLHDRLQNCAGGDCDQLRDRLRLHEEVQNCHLSQRGCRELRMQEREQVRPRFGYGNGGGMGSGMGRGMGGQGRGGMGN